MPGRVKVAVALFIISGLVLAVWGLGAVFGRAESARTDLGGVLGIVELACARQLLDGRQLGRMIAMSLCLCQTVLGLSALTGGIETHDVAWAFALVVLAGAVVIPLASDDAEQFFGTAP